MRIEAPCRLGERFRCEQSFHKGRFTLTGLDFFYWSSQTMPGVTLNGKRDPGNRQENTAFFYPKDAEEGVRIAFEVPDALMIPGYPLRELGLDTDAVGSLQGLDLTEGGWEYHVYFGKIYGGPRRAVRTEELDRLFEPVLPLHAVHVNLEDFLI